ncbi:MAG: glycogen synthase GlgA [Armatimonadetes bacterium]|nr:glycogen synthase GlgA [Armatimonadota bacterium]MDW8121463.1 glycogen synthase GlgA [Armatimonadota bacterium]
MEGVTAKGKRRGRRAKKNLLFVASEMFPFAKTGGLADVVGALPKELARSGHDVRVVMPKYRATFKIEQTFQRVATLPNIPFGGFQLGCAIDRSDALSDDGVMVYFIEHFGFYDREHLYGYDDDWLRFGLLCRAALELCKVIKFKPCVIHCHDWQSGLVPAFLKTIYINDPFFRGTATVYTVHNLAYQGNFDRSVLEPLGLPSECFSVNGVEFHGTVSFMKAGLYYADLVTTVSPTYAQEIQTTAYGEGFHGLLQTRASEKRLIGILNGIDTSVWNPATDKYLVRRYDGRSVRAGKKENNLALRQRVGLSDNSYLLIGIVSRLAYQKGFDVIAALADRLFAQPVQLVVLGAGEQEPLFAELQRRYPDRVACRLGIVDEELAHLIYAGADAFLIPSRFEPCGLTQMIAMNYGTPPIVHGVGGLKDTVVDFRSDTERGTGFVFSSLDPDQILYAISRCYQAFADQKVFLKIAREGMKKDFSWRQSACQYDDEAYERAMAIAQGISNSPH